MPQLLPFPAPHCTVLTDHNPIVVYTGLMLVLSNSCGWAWTAVRTVPLPLNPLRAARLNVTADYDQASWA